jgi:hypothetical protein
MNFELSLCGGALARPHSRAVGDLERSLPWATLDPSRIDPAVLVSARRRWTELAFNEHRSIVLMSQLLQALGEAQVPLDLYSIACAFPLQELVHAEVCARVVSRLGGAADVETATLETRLETRVGLTPAQRCHELVVRFCCVGETLSKCWLARMRQRVAHPLVRAVLSRILRDEALHSGFGWLYLDWCLGDGLLDGGERKRLAAVARDALDPYTKARNHGETSGEESPPDILVTLPGHEMRQWLAQAVREVQAGLERRGLEMASPPDGLR